MFRSNNPLKSQKNIIQRKNMPLRQEKRRPGSTEPYLMNLSHSIPGESYTNEPGESYPGQIVRPAQAFESSYKQDYIDPTAPLNIDYYPSGEIINSNEEVQFNNCRLDGKYGAMNLNGSIQCLSSICAVANSNKCTINLFSNYLNYNKISSNSFNNSCSLLTENNSMELKNDKQCLFAMFSSTDASVCDFYWNNLNQFDYFKPLGIIL